ncbi:MAG: hypothetical protein K0S80_3230 [Neobacillus sp.]|jgi:transcriptional regulator with XRE-family HTH domain|nr:hypothetical protein [Neobacillus sp.]
MGDIMPLVEKIKELAKIKGTTIAELERKLDFGNSTIRKWSTQSPSVERLQKVADYFNVPIDYLLNDDFSAANESKSWLRADPDLSKEEQLTIASEMADYYEMRKRRYLERQKRK